MTRKYKIAAGVLILLLIVVLSDIFFHQHPVAVLDPKGPVAAQERHLIYTALGLSLFVVIPVFAITFFIAWKYRDGRNNDYRPDWDGNRVAETTWWLIPTILIVILSSITWKSTHALDPYKPLSSRNAQLTIQVVALDWKWLFIYPQQNIATVNYLEMPVNTSVDFEITADAPMNSFWVPQLGGQIYAMPGMATELHLMAWQTGNFYGSSANISGAGFAGMNFVAQGVTAHTFKTWVAQAHMSPHSLGIPAYNQLAQPSTNNPRQTYNTVAKNLFITIINKYMTPTTTSMPAATPTMLSMGGM